MEDETVSCAGIVGWITKLTRKIASGKIVPMYYGENLPPPIAIAAGVRSRAHGEREMPVWSEVFKREQKNQPDSTDP